jgi:hypothetical protein
MNDFNQYYGSFRYLSNDSDSRLLETLARKQLFQGRFPQNFAEVSILGSATLPAKHNAVTESSALLYWVLTSSEVFGVPPVDDSEFSATEVQDTDGDGLKEFVDGWGRPLRFYRSPTMLFRPGNGTLQPGAAVNSRPPAWDNTRSYANAIWSGLPSVASNGFDPLVIDPDDPAAQMFIVSSYDSTGTLLAVFQNLFSTPSTYHAFLIVSPGPDGVLGLGEPFDYNGTNDPTQVPPATITSPNYNIPPSSTTPALGVAQGRLAAPDPTYASASIQNHPINDNLSNRKR